MSELTFAMVDFDTIMVAIETQKTIFPHEDGTMNFLASMGRGLFMDVSGLFYEDDHVKYYLAYVDRCVVGITGLYYYNKYPSDAWVGWYGVLPDFRNKGYGGKILSWTADTAKRKGFACLRLYTDAGENANAIKLYEKSGFVGEKYEAEKMNYDCWIYSKNLTDDKLELWDNRLLDLSYQSELDHLSADEIKRILKKYPNLIENNC